MQRLDEKFQTVSEVGVCCVWNTNWNKSCHNWVQDPRCKIFLGNRRVRGTSSNPIKSVSPEKCQQYLRVHLIGTKMTCRHVCKEINFGQRVGRVSIFWRYFDDRTEKLLSFFPWVSICRAFNPLILSDWMATPRLCLTNSRLIAGKIYRQLPYLKAIWQMVGRALVL